MQSCDYFVQFNLSKQKLIHVCFSFCVESCFFFVFFFWGGGHYDHTHKSPLYWSPDNLTTIKVQDSLSDK